MQRTTLMAIALFTALPAAAQTSFVQSPAYKECTALATSNPAAALVKADEWLKLDTSISAQHCRAMALYGLRRFEESGVALDAVRDSIPRENINLRIYVTEQAVRTWTNANRADAALTTMSTQIDAMGGVKGDNATAAKYTADLLLARARINATYGRLADATKDLDHAVSLSPLNEEVLLERASAFEQLGDASLARADLQVVLKINPANAKAQAALQKLDVKINKQIPEKP